MVIPMKKSQRHLAALIAVTLLLLLPYGASSQPERFDIPLGNAVFKGPADAPVTIIEFLDFQ